MDFDSVFPVFKSVLLDWRVIATLLAVVIYLNFIFYVAQYRKGKKPPAKARVARAAKPAAAPAEGDDENAETGGLEE